MWKKLTAVLLSAGIAFASFATVSAPAAEAAPMKFTKRCEINIRDARLRLRPQETRLVPASRPYYGYGYNDSDYGRKRNKRGNKGRNKGRYGQRYDGRYGNGRNYRYDRSMYRGPYAVNPDLYRAIDLRIDVKKGPIYLDPYAFELVVMDKVYLQPIFSGRAQEMQRGRYANGTQVRTLFFPDLVLTKKEAKKKTALVLYYRGYGTTCIWAVPAREK